MRGIYLTCIMIGLSCVVSLVFIMYDFLRDTDPDVILIIFIGCVLGVFIMGVVNFWGHYISISSDKEIK